MIVPFILLTIVSYFIDIGTLKCDVKDTRVEILRYLHHVMAVYGYFGSLFFGNYVFHLFYMLTLWAGWKVIQYRTGREQCFVTLLVNKMCGFKEEEGFHDLNWLLFNSKLYYLIFVFDIFMILKTRNLLG